MRMITACCARAPQRCTSPTYMHFLPMFQEVKPISKTRNQLNGKSIRTRTRSSHCKKSSRAPVRNSRPQEKPVAGFFIPAQLDVHNLACLMLQAW